MSSADFPKGVSSDQPSSDLGFLVGSSLMIKPPSGFSSPGALTTTFSPLMMTLKSFPSPGPLSLGSRTIDSTTQVPSSCFHSIRMALSLVPSADTTNPSPSTSNAFAPMISAPSSHADRQRLRFSGQAG